MERELRERRPTLALMILSSLLLVGCSTWQVEREAISSIHRLSPADIRIGSFNIHYDAVGDQAWPWPERREAVCKLIRAEAPHVLGLQEVTTVDGMQILPSVQMHDLQRLLPDYSLAGCPPNEHALSSNPIFYRKDALELLDTGVIYFKGNSLKPPEGPRRQIRTRFACWARFRLRHDGRTLVIANAHYHHLSITNRARATRELIRHLPAIAGDDPLIIVGDLNSFARSMCVRRLREELELEDALAGIRGGTFHDEHGRAPWPRIDHILVPAGSPVIQSWISCRCPDGVLPSDHYPVFADVRL